MFLWICISSYSLETLSSRSQYSVLKVTIYSKACFQNVKIYWHFCTHEILRILYKKAQSTLEPLRTAADPSGGIVRHPKANFKLPETWVRHPIELEHLTFRTFQKRPNPTLFTIIKPWRSLQNPAVQPFAAPFRPYSTCTARYLIWHGYWKSR